MAKYTVDTIGIRGSSHLWNIEHFFHLLPAISCKGNIAKGKLVFKYSRKSWNKEKINNYLDDLGVEINTHKVVKKKRMELHIYFLLISLLLAICPVYLSSAYQFDLYKPSLWTGLILNIVSGTLLQFGVGLYFYDKVIVSLRHRQIRSSFLLVIATSLMYCYSIINIVNFAMNDFAIANDYNAYIMFHLNAMLFIVFLFAKVAEHSLASYTSDYQKALSHFSIDKVIKITESGEEILKVEDIEIGDIIKIEANNLIPLDGIIKKGFSYFDKSIITGDSRPIYNSVGDQLSSGIINKSQAIEMEVIAKWEDSLLSKIGNEVAKSNQLKDVKTNNIINRIFNIMTPIVLLVATASLLINYYLLDKSWNESFTILLSIIIVSIPASLTLAAPISMLVGLGKFDAADINVKYQQVIDETASAKAIIFSHIGTLTTGRPWIKSYKSENKKYDNILMAIEASSIFPLAKIIVNYLTFLGAKKIDIQIENLANGRVKAIFNNEEYYFGSYAFAKELLKDNKDIEDFYQAESASSQILLFLMNKERAVIKIAISDRLKETASPTIRRVKQCNITPYLLSTENKMVALDTAERIGMPIENVYHSISPTDKIKVLEEVKAKHHEVIFVGDSINDAPCIVRSDVGITISDGQNISVETSDITLKNDDLTAIPRIIDFARAIVNNRKINIFIGVFYPIILIPFAWLGFIGLLQAIFSIIICQLIVAFNAVRIRQIRIL